MWIWKIYPYHAPFLKCYDCAFEIPSYNHFSSWLIVNFSLNWRFNFVLWTIIFATHENNSSWCELWFIQDWIKSYEINYFFGVGTTLIRHSIYVLEWDTWFFCSLILFKLVMAMYRERGRKLCYLLRVKVIFRSNWIFLYFPVVISCSKIFLSKFLSKNVTNLKLVISHSVNFSLSGLIIVCITFVQVLDLCH